jgi:hypothetical protein
VEKQFVPYEIALRLRELGFDQECLGRYEERELHIVQSNNIGKRKFVQAPLWQQVIDWLETKDILVSQIKERFVKVKGSKAIESIMYRYKLTYYKTGSGSLQQEYFSSESLVEVKLEAINKALKLINKNHDRI